MNFIKARQNNCVKIANVTCNWSISLCDNCNKSVLPCGPDEVSAKSQTGPMRVFHTFNEGYIKWEHKCWQLHHVKKLSS